MYSQQQLNSLRKPTTLPQRFLHIKMDMWLDTYRIVKNSMSNGKVAVYINHSHTTVHISNKW